MSVGTYKCTYIKTPCLTPEVCLFYAKAEGIKFNDSMIYNIHATQYMLVQKFTKVHCYVRHNIWMLNVWCKVFGGY